MFESEIKALLMGAHEELQQIKALPQELKDDPSFLSDIHQQLARNHRGVIALAMVPYETVVSTIWLSMGYVRSALGHASRAAWQITPEGKRAAEEYAHDIGEPCTPAMERLASYVLDNLGRFL